MQLEIVGGGWFVREMIDSGLKIRSMGLKLGLAPALIIDKGVLC